MHRKFTFPIFLFFSFFTAASMEQDNKLISRFCAQAVRLEGKFVECITSQDFEKAHWLLQNFSLDMRKELDKQLVNKASLEELLEFIKRKRVAIHHVFKKIPAYEITPTKLVKILLLIAVIQAMYWYLREKMDLSPVFVGAILFGIMKCKINKASSKIQNILDQCIDDIEQRLALCNKNADRSELLEESPISRFA